QRMNDAARRAGLPLVGHAPVNLGLDAMLEARQPSLAHIGELTRLYFNPVVRRRWSLVAGGAGLLIMLLVTLTSGLMTVVGRYRRVPRRQPSRRTASVILGAAGLTAAGCYAGFSPGGPLFRSDGLRVAFTAAALLIAGATLALGRHRSLMTIPGLALSYWVAVWTPIAWRSSEAGIDDVARRLKAADIVVQSTLVVYDTFSASRRPLLAGDPAIDYLQPSVRASWRRLPAEVTGLQVLNRYPEFTRQVATALHRAGVQLVVGTDALGAPLITPGSSLHRELALLHDAGLRPYEVLRAATAAPAAFLGKADEFGTIQVGQRADLLLLEQDPLASLATLREPLAVMVRGQWLAREQLDAMLAALRQP
ncbi:MAG TPA: amidohydrolase family protein, partial [Dehalococcoidia bacterium]